MIGLLVVGVVVVLLWLRHRHSVRRRKDTTDALGDFLGLAQYRGPKWRTGKDPRL